MAERWIDTSKDEAFLFLYGFALSRHVGLLPDPNKPRKVIKAVFTFAKKRLAKFTRAQLAAAVDYALLGADWTAGAAAPKAKAEGEQRNSSAVGLGPSPSPTIGLLTDCRMLRLPISLDDARRMTASELTEAINRCWSECDKKFDPKASHARAFGEYVRAREAIRARSMAQEPADD